MTLKRHIKNFLFKIMIFKPINLVLIYCQKSLGISFGRNIPVNKNIEIDLPNKEKLKFESRGEDSIISELFYGGFESYEPETISIFLKLLEGIDTFVDVGANSGIFSLIASKMNQESNVFSFEPENKSFGILSGYIKTNNIKNIHAENFAVSDIDGELSFYIPESSSLPLGGSTRNDVHEKVNKIKVTVNSVSLDTYFKNKNYSSLDLMKIDTEGTEDKVLTGCSGLIKKFEPSIICEVLPGFTEQKLNEFFGGLNYSYYRITESGLLKMECIEGDKTYKFKNFLFIPNKRLNDYFNSLIIQNDI